MAYSVKIGVEGVQELQNLFDEMANELGPKDSQRILNKAVRTSMIPVLNSARQLAPVDTGALRASLQIEVRKPNRKDKRSKYVSENDTVIGLVTTAPASKLAKTKFKNMRTESKFMQIGIASDARAVANEFGTAKMPAQPFMRPALESNAQNVVNSLSVNIATALRKYKSKHMKKG
jgi:HK97 gp10 family phage protein